MNAYAGKTVRVDLTHRLDPRRAIGDRARTALSLSFSYGLLVVRIAHLFAASCLDVPPDHCLGP